MMKEETKENKALKEIIKKTINEVLAEDDGGDYGSGSGDYGTGGMGSIYSDPANGGLGGYSGNSTAAQSLSSLSGILPIGIVPGVVKTLMWGVENMTSRVVRLLKTFYSYITKAFIPGFDAIDDYKKFRQDEVTQLAKTDQKYAETLKANLAVLHDLDAWGIMFLLDPSLGLGWRLLENAPAAAMAIANSLTGGRASDLVKREVERQGGTRSVARQNNGEETPRKSRYGLERDPQIRNIFNQLGIAGGIDEAVEDSMKNAIPILKSVFSSKEFKEAVKQAGVSKKIQAFAYNAIINRAKLVLDKQTLEELATVPELAAATSQVIQVLNQQAQAQGLAPQEIEQMKKGALGQLKEKFKKMTIDNLVKNKNSNTSALIDSAIKQIQSMK